MKCSVYILGGMRCPVKVGIATNAILRAGDIRSSAPWPVRLLNEWEFDFRSVAYAIEQTAHAMLWEDRMKGEWFRASFATAAGAVEEAIGLVEDHIPLFQGDLSRERPLWYFIRAVVLDE